VNPPEVRSNVIPLRSGITPAVTRGDFRIPLLGRIAAGLPIEAIEDQSHLDLAEFFIGPDRYALRVTGESMIDAGILDGDTVILRKQNTARKGEIVVALIDGQEATLKRLGEVADGMIELIPENEAMQTMRYSVNRVSIQGVLVGQLRSY
jgi:repressor LexA